jgi:arylsulfatase A-like enzyme
MKLTIKISILSLILGLSIIAGCASEKEKYPNIVYILADDLGYGDVSALNPESKISTPNLDRLAQEGITFTDAHSGSAVCTPTRYGILTGRYCWRTPLKSSVLWPWDGPLIEADRLTVGSFLKQHGYTTACIGKWHLGWDWSTFDGSGMNEEIPPGKWDSKVRGRIAGTIDFSGEINNGPVTRGFDYYFGDDVPNFPPYCFIENNRTIGLPSMEKPDSMYGNPGIMLEGWKLEEVMPALTRKAVEYIKAGAGEGLFKKERDKPFFLYFPLTAPHTPIAPTADFIGTSDAGAYGDFVQEVDWTVGQVMKALEEMGLAENTLLIFTSDNGSPGRDRTDMGGPPVLSGHTGTTPAMFSGGSRQTSGKAVTMFLFLPGGPGKYIQDRRVMRSYATLTCWQHVQPSLVNHCLIMQRRTATISCQPCRERSTTIQYGKQPFTIPVVDPLPSARGNGNSYSVAGPGVGANPGTTWQKKWASLKSCYMT